MAAHAKLSPSAAERWMTCPGSVHLIDVRNIKSVGGAAANKGTVVHHISEQVLKGKTKKLKTFLDKTIDNIVVSQDMIDAAQYYIDFVSSLPGDKFYEQKVSIEHIIGDCWGTADTVVATAGSLLIADLKSGAGVKVYAQNNRQLLIYALGAFYKYDLIYDFQTITMVIVQPPLDHISTWSVSVEELLAFEEELLVAKQKIEYAKDKFVITDKGCQWCPAKAVCPAHLEIANQAAQIDFKTSLPEDLSYWLDKLPALKGFIAIIEEKAYEKLVAGEVITGFGLGKPAKRRTWSDEDIVRNVVSQLGLEKYFYKEVLISPAQCDKLNLDSDMQEAINELISFTESKPSIVRKDSAKSDFS